jgi:BlaI family transcriptional regulator, penicillinase repressor
MSELEPRERRERRVAEISFTDRELDVMGVLWEHGPATVAEVRSALQDELAYTTVLTVLRILEEKAYVGHTAEGKAHRYHPLVGREAAGESAVRKLVRKVFGGSRELLFTHLVSDRDLSDDELQRLRRLLDDRLERGEP